MSEDNWIYAILGCVVGAAITAGIIWFFDSTPQPVCENEVFTVCLYQKRDGFWGTEHVHKSGKAECYAYPLKEYDVKSIYTPFDGKRITKKNNPAEIFFYRSNDYIRAENVCTDSVVTVKE